MAKKKRDEEEIEFDELEEEIEEDEDPSAIECKLCESETEIGRVLCDDCGQCASCGDEWDYKDARVAKKTEDGRVCETCWTENYSEGDEIEDSDEVDEDEDYDEDEESDDE